ncbi:hypothetical protein RR46_12589 [Papilio xuthus]|uniref:Uncharacterized protein n=1 Tax=Papilio xuthus TaxID=66420 RepID=A0A194PUZ0_PAPXU|nr:hypothetical protein RR46_12589 [Papilio xuthus]
MASCFSSCVFYTNSPVTSPLCWERTLFIFSYRFQETFRVSRRKIDLRTPRRPTNKIGHYENVASCFLRFETYVFAEHNFVAGYRQWHVPARAFLPASREKMMSRSAFVLAAVGLGLSTFSVRQMILHQSRRI